MANKKKLDYSIMSDKICSCCGNPLKQNLVDRIPNANLDYFCTLFMKDRNRVITRYYQQKEADNTITQRAVHKKLKDVIKERRRVNQFTSSISL